MPIRSEPVSLALEGITKTYGPVTAVEDLSLIIEPGEIIALLGPSGCGKTTSLRMIAGLINPSSGQIVIGGRRVTAVPAHQRNIGMLFQSYALFPHMTVFQNVSFGLEMRGVGATERLRRVKEALQLVQLTPYADRFPQALSGGQQQRVALARALVIEPSLLLLDEPLGALDKALRENMQVELRQLQQRLGITTVIVTHDQEEALTLSDRIVIMRGGKIEQFDTPENVYSRPKTKFVASFVGASNFFEAEATGKSGQQSCFMTKSGLKIVARGGAAVGSFDLLTRPESIHVEKLEGNWDNRVNSAAGVIEQRVYRGGSVHLHLRLDDGTPMLAFQPPMDPGSDMNPGTRIVASWAEKHVHVIENP